MSGILVGIPRGIIVGIPRGIIFGIPRRIKKNFTAFCFSNKGRKQQNEFWKNYKCSAWIPKKFCMSSARSLKEFQKNSVFCIFLIKNIVLLILGTDWAHTIFSKLLQTKPFLTNIKMQYKSLLVVKVDSSSFSDESWVWIFLFIYVRTHH